MLHDVGDMLRCSAVWLVCSSEPLSGETGCHSTSMTAVSDSVMDCGLGIKKEISVSARRLTDEVHVPEMRDFQERLTALEERLRMKDAEIVAMGKRLHLKREQQKVTERERRRHEDKVTQLCAKQVGCGSSSLAVMWCAL